MRWINAGLSQDCYEEFYTGRSWHAPLYIYARSLAPAQGGACVLQRVRDVSM